MKVKNWQGDELNLPHSKMWYQARETFRNSGDLLDRTIDFLKEEVPKTKQHFRELYDFSKGNVPNCHSGLGTMITYDFICIANRWGLDLGYRILSKNKLPSR